MRHSMIVAIGILMITSLCWAQAQPGEPVQLPAPEVGQAGPPAPAPAAGEITNATPPPPPPIVAQTPAQPAGTPEAELLQRALDKIEVAKQQMAEMRGKNSQLEADNQRLAARPTTVETSMVVALATAPTAPLLLRPPDRPSLGPGLRTGERACGLG